jgi:hypothetical protein
MAVEEVFLLNSPVQVTVSGGLIPSGAYNALTAYVVGDSVSYNGSSYVALTSTTGNLPTNTTYWQLLASIGNTGATGATGSTGATGATGAAIGGILTTLGDMVYEDATPTAVRLAGNTTTAKQFLTQTGTGTISAAPAWGTIANTDVSGLGTLSTLNSIDLTANVGATVLPILNGGTGSSTQNFVDLSSTQASIAGNKGFTGLTTMTTSAGTYALTVTGGNYLVQDAVSATKAYRFRTNGSSLDLDAAGSTLILSVYDNANFTGTQRIYMEFGQGATYVTCHDYFEWKDSSSVVQFQIDPDNKYVRPGTNNTIVLGDSSHYWSNLYATTLNLNSTASLSGGTAGQITMTVNGGSTGSGGIISNDTGASSGTSDYTAYTFKTGDSGTYAGAMQALYVRPQSNVTTKWNVAAKFNPVHQGGSLSKLSAFYCVPETGTSFTSGTIAIMCGFESQPYIDASGGTITELDHIRLDALGGSSSPTITTMNGIAMSDPGKTIGTLRGIYISSLTSGTTNYAIYTNAGLVHFGDKVDLAASTTSAASLNIPATGVAPTSPVAGDMYNDGTHLYIYQGGAWVALS